MFSNTLRTALIALTTLAVAVVAEPSLSVKVSGPDSVNGVDSLKLVTTITNTGDETVKVLNDPRGALSQLPANTFSITNSDGSQPNFTGIKVKYVPEVAAANGAYTTLAPGQSTQVEHDLAHTYDFTHPGEGAYDIHATGTFLVVDEATSKVVPIQAKVTSHKVHLSGKLRAPRPQLDKRATYNGCSSTRQSQLLTAASSAQSYASAAVSYLNSHTSTSTRFTTWFGTFSASKRSTVLSHYTNINSHDISSYKFDCTCTESGTYAYVYADTFGTVYLCGAFWNAPNTGTDSKAGTLIHESSHFTVNGGTDDYVYGQSGAKSLAISNPSEAIFNADSHEYFAENNPAQS